MKSKGKGKKKRKQKKIKKVNIKQIINMEQYGEKRNGDKGTLTNRQTEKKIKKNKK